MAYPPQQGQYGGYPGHGAPPKKDRAPLIASMIFVAAVLAGLVITGFVAPGFFLSDDDGTSGGNSAGAGGADSPGSAAETPAADGGDADVRAFADDLVAAANAKDKTALREFPCPDARSGVAQAIAEIVTIDGAELRGVSEVDAETYVVGVSITYEGQSAPFAATVTKSGDGWCWQDFAPGSGGSGDSGDSDDGPASGPGSGSGADTGAAEAFAEEFVAALNAKDADKANGMYCPDAAKGIVDYVVGKNPRLAIDGTDTTNVFHTAMLTGTLDGKPLRRGKITVELKGSHAPCVFTFSAG